MARGKGISAAPLFMLLLFGIVGLYLFGQFSAENTCTQADVDNDRHGCTDVTDTYRGLTVPGDMDDTALWVMKILILGVVVFAAFAAVNKISVGALSRKDAFTIIVLGLALWFLWDNVLATILNAPTLGEMSFEIGQKMGFFK